MRSAYLTAATILIGAALSVEFLLRGADPLIIALVMGIAGLLAGVAVIEPYVAEVQRRAADEVMAEWILRDPWHFGKHVADLYARQLREADDETLTESYEAVVYLATVLEEFGRIARLSRAEALARSRAWHPTVEPIRPVERPPL